MCKPHNKIYNRSFAEIFVGEKYRPIYFKT